MNSSDVRSQSALRKGPASGNGRQRGARGRDAGNVPAGGAPAPTGRLRLEPTRGSSLQRARRLITARARAGSAATGPAAEAERPAAAGKPVVVPAKSCEPISAVFKHWPLEMSFIAFGLAVALSLGGLLVADLLLGWPFGRAGAAFDVCMMVSCAGLLFLCHDACRGLRRRKSR